jgi:hypothetical protein
MKPGLSGWTATNSAAVPAPPRSACCWASLSCLFVTTGLIVHPLLLLVATGSNELSLNGVALHVCRHSTVLLWIGCSWPTDCGQAQCAAFLTFHIAQVLQLMWQACEVLGSQTSGQLQQQ